MTEQGQGRIDVGQIVSLKPAESVQPKTFSPGIQTCREYLANNDQELLVARLQEELKSHRTDSDLAPLDKKLEVRPFVQTTHRETAEQANRTPVKPFERPTKPTSYFEAKITEALKRRFPDKVDHVLLYTLYELRQNVGIQEFELENMNAQQIDAFLDEALPVVEHVESIGAKALYNDWVLQGRISPHEIPSDAEILSVFRQEYAGNDTYAGEEYGKVIGLVCKELIFQNGNESTPTLLAVRKVHNKINRLLNDVQLPGRPHMGELSTAVEKRLNNITANMEIVPVYQEQYLDHTRSSHFVRVLDATVSKVPGKDNFLYGSQFGKCVIGGALHHWDQTVVPQKDRDLFDLTGIAILSELRGELGLTETQLASLKPKEIQELVTALKPIVKTIEISAAHALLNHMRKHNIPIPEPLPEDPDDILYLFKEKYRNNTNVSSDIFGTIVGEEVRQLLQRQEAHDNAKIAYFTEQQEARSAVLEGKKDLAKEKEGKRIDRALNKVNRGKKKVIQRLEQITTSYEGRGIFKKNRTARQSAVDVGVALAPAEIERAAAYLGEEPLDRIHQLGFVGAFYFMRRLDIAPWDILSPRSILFPKLKNGVNWDMIGRTAIRGTASAVAVLATEVAIQQFLIHSGLAADTRISEYIPQISGLLDLPIKIAAAKLIVNGAFNTLGINTGAEAAINHFIHKKNDLDTLAEYLHFRASGNDTLANAITTRKHPPRWKLIADFLDQKELDPQDLRTVAIELKNAELQMRMYNNIRYERYKKRQIMRAGHTYVIDNEAVFEKIMALEAQLYTHSVKELFDARAEEIKHILVEGPQDTKAYIRRKTLTHRALTASLGTALNAAYIVGATIPVVKEVGTQFMNTVLGDATPIPSPQPIAMGRFQNEPELPAFFESDSLTQSNFNEFSLIAAPLTDQFIDLVSLYESNPHILTNDQLTQHGVTLEDLKTISDTFKNEGLSTQDIKLIMRVLFYEDKPHHEPSSDSILNQLYTNMRNGQQKGNLKATFETFKQTVALRQTLQEQLEERGLQHEVGIRDFSLLAKLGIDHNTVDYQSEFLPEAERTEMIQKAQMFQIDSKGHVFMKDIHGWASVDVYSESVKVDVRKKSTFVLQQIGNLINADSAEFTKAFDNETYLDFLSQVNFAYNPNLQLTYGNTFIIAPDSEYLYNIRNLIAQAAPEDVNEHFFSNKLNTLLDKAIQGDPKAFNELYETLSEQYPGRTYWAFRSNDTQNNQSLIRNIVEASKTFTHETPQEKLVHALNKYKANFGLIPVSATFQEDPAVFNVDKRVFINPDESLARLLTGQVDLNTELEHLLGMPTVIVKSEGSTYFFNKFAHQKISDMPPELIDWAKAVEGESHPTSDIFLFNLLKGNIGAVVANEINPSSTMRATGASDPAMQLTELIMGGPESSQSVLSVDSAWYPSFFARQSSDYNFEYLLRLLATINNGKIPKELEDIIVNVHTIDRSKPETLGHENGERLIDTNDKIKRICWKLESYILSRRLLSLYGEDAVIKAWLNYVPMSTVNGQNVFGMETFARIFFGKHLNELSDAERALTIANINNPIVLSPLRNDGKQLKQDAIDRVVYQLVQHNRITEERADQLIQEIEAVTFKKPADSLPPELGNASLLGSNNNSYEVNAAYTQAAQAYDPTLEAPQHKPTTTSSIPGVGTVATVMETKKEELPSYEALKEFATPYADLHFQKDVELIIDAILPDSPDPKTHLYHLVLNDPNIPNKNYGVDIPSFDIQMPDDTVKSVPGIGFILMKDNKVTGYYDPTGVFVNGETFVGLPSEMASTSKTLNFAFLVSEGFDPDKPWDNRPGAIAMIKSKGLPVHNPYAALESMSSNNKLSLRQALAFSSDAAWFNAMHEYFNQHPDAWERYVAFAAKIGIEFVDNEGKPVTQPTAYFPIGTDLKVKGGIATMAYAYQYVMHPDKMFKGEGKEKLIYAFNEARKTITDLAYRSNAKNLAHPETPNVGFRESEWLIQQQAPINNRQIASKTGTLGGSLGIQKQFVAIGLPDGTIAYMIVQGQTADGRLKTLSKYASETTLPLTRVILSRLMDQNKSFAPLPEERIERKLNSFTQ